MKERLRKLLDSRKTPYPAGTKRNYLVGGLVAIAFPVVGIMLAYYAGAYDGPGEWMYALITPWHLLTLVGLYFIVMAYLIKEKRN